MASFDLVTPQSLGEAASLLDPDDPTVRPIAGGTALVLMLKSGLFRPRRLVSLRRIAELSGIVATEEGELRIGAMATLSELEASAELADAAPVIGGALKDHSNVRVRNVASVGGNLALADPHMDLPPILIVLGARLEVLGKTGRRAIPVEGFYTGYYETCLEGGELITALLVPRQGAWRAVYRKVTTRAADDWPALAIAVALHWEGREIRGARLALGAATETPMRLSRAEALLAGARVEERLIGEVAQVAAEEAPVVADARGSAAYKRVLLRVHLERALAELLELTP